MTQPDAFLAGAPRALSTRTSEAIGRNPDRRTGTVLSFDAGELTVQIAGGQVARAGYLESYTPVVGDVVSLILQRSTWLCLGKLVDPTAAAPPVVPVTNGIQIFAGAQFEQNYVFINVTGLSFSFTKKEAATRLFVQFAGSGYADTVSDVLEFGALINGADYGLSWHFFNIANCHFGTAGFQFISGVPAATYTVQGRFRIASGPGTVRLDSNDKLSLACTEVD
jgi:hypothetical protein